MAASENDLLSRFIENEKKSKRVTLISVVGFMGLAFVIVLLMGELQKAKDLADNQKKETINALARADSVIQAFETFKKSVSNIAVKQEVSPITVIPPPPRAIDSGDGPETREKLIARSRAYRRNITVFLQYRDSYAKESDAVMTALKAANFNVPGKELIRRINFGTGVKYFNDSDKPWADSVAKVVGQQLSKPIPVIKNDINAPIGQLEVWLGDFQKVEKAVLLQKYSQEKIVL